MTAPITANDLTTTEDVFVLTVVTSAIGQSSPGVAGVAVGSTSRDIMAATGESEVGCSAVGWVRVTTIVSTRCSGGELSRPRRTIGVGRTCGYTEEDVEGMQLRGR